jgi:predicted DCC family thiol-disulfide oxidoreductase YuxK
MKTLENHTLLYDEDCSLCKVYTTGFIKTGMLDQNGRQAYSTISNEDKTSSTSNVHLMQLHWLLIKIKR